MLKLKRRVLIITEDFPSGLSGSTVKTRNLINFLLKDGFRVDVCCYQFAGFALHNLEHPQLKVYTAKTSRPKRRSVAYWYYLGKLLLSLTPITVKRLFNQPLAKQINQLLRQHLYGAVLFDGYAALQYLPKTFSAQKIYIDHEDFTDLFRQRWLLESSRKQRIFFLTEYLKNLVFEKMTLNKVDQIWAVSPATQKRLARISGVKTVLMPTIISVEKNCYQGQGTNLVFTGTLNWRENLEGLTWFLNNHWALIRKKLPMTTLTVIGQGASPGFIKFLERQPGVKYLGYTPNLKTEYQQATLAISPIRINAGIKVKTLTYLSFGLPVISLAVAARGLVSTDGVAVVSEKNFGLLTVALLKNLKLRQYLSEQAHYNIRVNYAASQLKRFLSQHLSF